MQYLNHFYKPFYIDYLDEKVLCIQDESSVILTKKMVFILSGMRKKGSFSDFCLDLENIGFSYPEKVLEQMIGQGFLSKIEKKSFYKFFLKILFFKVYFIKAKFFKNMKFLSFNMSDFFFFILFFIGFLISLFFVFSPFKNSFEILSFWDIFLVFLVIVFHEIGHSSMMFRKGLGFRSIGFALYLMFPVLLTNVSGIYLLSLKNRVMVNLAGLVYQTLGTLFLLFVSFFINIKYSVFISLSYMFLFNMNPFIHTDGYWVLKDINSFLNKLRFWNFFWKIFYVCFFAYTFKLLYGIFFLAVYFFQNANFSLEYLISSCFYVYMILMVSFGLFQRIKEVKKELFKKGGGY